MNKITPDKSWPSIIIWSYIFINLVLISMLSRYLYGKSIYAVFSILILSFIVTIILFVMYYMDEIKLKLNNIL